MSTETMIMKQQQRTCSDPNVHKVEMVAKLRVRDGGISDFNQIINVDRIARKHSRDLGGGVAEKHPLGDSISYLLGCVVDPSALLQELTREGYTVSQFKIKKYSSREKPQGDSQ